MNCRTWYNFLARLTFAAVVAMAFSFARQAVADDDVSVAADAETLTIDETPNVDDGWEEKSVSTDDEESRFLSGDSELGFEADLELEDDSFVTSSFSYLTDETVSSEDYGEAADDVTAVEWSAGIDVHKSGDKAEKDKKPAPVANSGKVVGTPNNDIVDLGALDLSQPVAEEMALDGQEQSVPGANAMPPDLHDAAVAAAESATQTTAESPLAGTASEAQQADPEISANSADPAVSVNSGDAASPTANAAPSNDEGHDGSASGPVQDQAAKEETQNAAVEEIHDQRDGESFEFQRMIR